MRIAVKWGVILGASVCVWTLIVHALGFYTTRIAAGQIADMVAIVLPVAAIVFAHIERARQTPITFKSALGMALIVGLVSASITVAFLWWYHHSMNPQWLDYLIEHQRASMAADGAKPDAIAQMETNQRASGTDAAQISGGFIGSTLISLVIGAVSGAVLRTRARNRPA